MLVPVLSKIHPVKCWDFAKRRRFPVRFPRFTVIVPDFQRSISAPIISQVFFSRIPEPARGVRITGRRAELGDRLGAKVRKLGQIRNSGNQVLCGKPRTHGGLALHHCNGAAECEDGDSWFSSGHGGLFLSFYTNEDTDTVIARQGLLHMVSTQFGVVPLLRAW